MRGGSPTKLCGFTVTNRRVLLLAALVFTLIFIAGYGYAILRFAPRGGGSGSSSSDEKKERPSSHDPVVAAAATESAETTEAAFERLCAPLERLPKHAAGCLRANKVPLPYCVSTVRGHQYSRDMKPFWGALTKGGFHYPAQRTQLASTWDYPVFSVVHATARYHRCATDKATAAAGCVFVDAGANTGYLTMHAARAGFDVVAFEPLRDNIDLVKFVVCVNQLYASCATPKPSDDAADAGQCLSQPPPNPDSHSVFATVAPANAAVGTGGRIEFLPFIISDTRATLSISGDGMDGHVTDSYAHSDLPVGREAEIDKNAKEKGVATPAVKLDDWMRSDAPLPSSSPTLNVQSNVWAINKRTKLSSAHHPPAGTTVKAASASGPTGRHITLLKIDTEGHEWQVIRGSLQLLRQGRISHIVLEYNLWRGMTSSEGLQMLWYLNGLGYECYDLERDGFPLIPSSEFEVMTKALKDDLPAPGSDGSHHTRGYKGRRWALNLWFSKTVSLTKLFGGTHIPEAPPGV